MTECFPKLTPISFPDEADGLEAARASAPVSDGSMMPGFEILFGKSPFPMWVYDSTSLRFLAVNDTALERYGWSREEFLTMTVDQLRPSEDVAAFLEFQRTRKDGNAGISESANWRHVTKAGEILAVQTAWQRIKFGGCPAFLVTAIDRSEQQRTEEENKELADVLNLASDAIIVCDIEREIQFWNQGAAKLYGWSVGEVIGKKAHDLFGMDSEGVLNCMTGLLSEGEWRGEMEHTCKGGRIAKVNSRWTLVRDDVTQKPKSVLLINTDITEAKNFEAQFLRAQRLESIGTLASGIAHDLNNILSPILMASGILRTSKLNDECLKMVDIIEGSAERGAGIVKQVLTFARGVDGERALLQPKHLVTEMVKVMTQTFPKNISITTTFKTEPWLVNGDATQLHQVLLNLCVNARDAMGEKGGSLSLSCTNEEVDEHMARTNPGAVKGPHTCFTVTDTGDGMSREVIEKIFDPFFTTKEQGKGTGLGLATVIGIIKGHKGFLTVQSQVGVGTTFRVFLPASVDAKEVSTKQDEASALEGNGELVLVVDDEAPVREALVAMLEGSGYRCFTAEDGTDALALYFERREIDLILTDLHMGVMDGIDLTRSVRRINPKIPVIISSGHIDKEKRATLEGLGVERMLEKPYTSATLLTAVKAMLHPAT